MMELHIKEDVWQSQMLAELAVLYQRTEEHHLVGENPQKRLDGKEPAFKAFFYFFFKKSKHRASPRSNSVEYTMIDQFYTLLEKQEEALLFVQKVITLHRGEEAEADSIAETVGEDIEQIITIIKGMKGKLRTYK